MMFLFNQVILDSTFIFRGVSFILTWDTSILDKSTQKETLIHLGYGPLPVTVANEGL